MTSDLDIYRAARLLVDRHGEDTPLVVSKRIDALLDEGDLDGQAMWCRIGVAVRELLAGPEGRSIH